MQFQIFKGRHRRSWRGIVGLVLCGAALSASAATYRVDDDMKDCRDAEFTSINAAIAAAAPGDTIQVCPGLYPEYVVVNKPLQIFGARKGNGKAPGRQDNPERESIVVNLGQGGFEVLASDVVIRGFTVQGNPAAASFPNAGIVVRAGTNRQVDSNVLRDNGLGLYTTGSQQDLGIERNAFVNNGRTPNVPGVAAGGIFSVDGPLRDVRIEQNLFTDNTQFCINISAFSPGGLVIAQNEAVDNGTFVVIGRSTDALITHNRVDLSRGPGISAFGENVRLRIEHNSIENGRVQGISFGIAFGATEPNLGTVIEHNRITGNGFAGIVMNEAHNSVVRYNHLAENGFDGLRLFDADNNRIAHNQFRDNARDGIRVEAQSTGNTIEYNVAFGNLEHDCHDDTVGPGTAGTANFWIKNKGKTENRPGLCKN